jgi:hypothetical protein
LRPEWEGDQVRDQYEIELLRGFIAGGKPVLGICRGAQRDVRHPGSPVHPGAGEELQTPAAIGYYGPACWCKEQGRMRRNTNKPATPRNASVDGSGTEGTVVVMVPPVTKRLREPPSPCSKEQLMPTQ